jgi:catechol 2,3-dioxygenase-like lactoylglutathione lyase family enzyme
LSDDIRLNHAAPTFLVPDVGATTEWYQKELGFECSHFPKNPPYVYASMRRDGVELILLRLEGYEKPDTASLRPSGCWDAYIRMSGVLDFYELLNDRPFIRKPLTKQGYGDIEFEVIDPNGYILVFSELISE